MQRTHLVNVHNVLESGAVNEYGSALQIWDPSPVASRVAINLQPLTGSVRQALGGRDIEASYQAFFPASVPLRADGEQGVVVVEVLPAGKPYVGPLRFRTRFVGSHGGQWDSKVFLDDTEEAIPGEAPEVL